MHAFQDVCRILLDSERQILIRNLAETVFLKSKFSGNYTFRERCRHLQGALRGGWVDCSGDGRGTRKFFSAHVEPAIVLHKNQTEYCLHKSTRSYDEFSLKILSTFYVEQYLDVVLHKK